VKRTLAMVLASFRTRVGREREKDRGGGGEERGLLFPIYFLMLTHIVTPCTHLCRCISLSCADAHCHKRRWTRSTLCCTHTQEHAHTHTHTHTHTRRRRWTRSTLSSRRTQRTQNPNKTAACDGVAEDALVFGAGGPREEFLS